ncbi:LysE family transporter [Methylobacterium oryzisoli]|uniref:LysE family transporter n=1 Tax=Methylobacterium oryzisoli TaxID=3385502 RepID=UPI00389169C2
MPDADVLTSLLLPLVASYALVLAVPGPNLLVVLHAGLGPSTRGALPAAFGIACGAALVSVLAASCAALLPSGRMVECLGSALFAALMARAGLRMLSGGARAAVDPARLAPGRPGATFFLGLGAAASNPVTFSFFAGFFLAHARTPEALGLAGLVVFAMAAAWFSAVGLLVSRPACRRLAAAGGGWVRYGIAAALLLCAGLALWRAAAQSAIA